MARDPWKDFGSFLERDEPRRPPKTKQPAERQVEVEEAQLDLCGKRHPNRSVRQCTLPKHHGPVQVPGVPFPMSHFDANYQVAWRETR